MLNFSLIIQTKNILINLLKPIYRFYDIFIYFNCRYLKLIRISYNFYPVLLLFFDISILILQVNIKGLFLYVFFYYGKVLLLHFFIDSINYLT